MANSIKISIPTPCHEDWAKMTPEGRGRFCAACQKTVTDFTKATDREIVTAYNQDAKLCGRFLSTQLDRELVIPKEKNSLWTTAAALVVLSLGGAEVLAQTPQTKTEFSESKPIATTDSLRTVTGIVFDNKNIPMPGAKVLIKDNIQSVTVTDMDGKFSIKAGLNDILYVTYMQFTKEVQLDLRNDYNIILQDENVGDIIIYAGYTTWESEPKKRTFFGRIFHAIGNIFR